MAKKMYIGVDGVARKVNKAYVGVDSPCKNLVTNGDFSNGLNNWTVMQSNYSTNEIITENNENILKIQATNTGQSSVVGVTQILTLDPEHKYYLCAYIKFEEGTAGTSSTTICGINFNTFWKLGGRNMSSEWGSYSTIISINSSYSFEEFKIGMYLQSVNDTAYFKNIRLYDITEMFGSGNEPTKEWCDKNLIDGKTFLARKVKKMYMGVEGVARCIFSGDGLEYYGTATNLSKARGSMGATTVGNYALFGGGYSGGHYRNLDAYNNSLTHSTLSLPQQGRAYLTATTVGDYALFGGGGANGMVLVDACNNSLTLSVATDLSLTKQSLAATSVGNYALFGGGAFKGTSTSYRSTVDAYDTSLTRTNPSELSAGRQLLAATTVGNYALFGGGTDGGLYRNVDTYNTSLTKSFAVLSEGKHSLAATTVGNYALFGGGTNGAYTSIVEAYNTSLTKTAPTELSIKRYKLAATSVGNYAFFGGGTGTGSAYYSTVDVYDISLTRTNPTELSVGRAYLSATSVGNYALFGGGQSDSSTYSSTVDVYQVS